MEGSERTVSHFLSVFRILFGREEVNSFLYCYSGNTVRVVLGMARIDSKNLKCSFCGKPQALAGRLISGENAYICEECVRVCMSILEEEYEPTLENQNGEKLDFNKLPKPVEIKRTLTSILLDRKKQK